MGTATDNLVPAVGGAPVGRARSEQEDGRPVEGAAMGELEGAPVGRGCEGAGEEMGERSTTRKMKTTKIPVA